MNLRKHIQTLLLLIVALAAAGLARGQDTPTRVGEPEKSQTPQAQPDDAQGQAKRREGQSEKAQISPALEAVTIEKIIEQAVKNISRRYNLNEAQTAKTDEIMKRGVYEFLAKHEEEVWPLIRDLMANGFRPPQNIEDVKRIGKAAGPLSKLAQQAILQGNEEWRTFLNAEQRQMHDYDLSEMQRTFDQMDERFELWASGRPPAGSIFPQPAPPEESPPRPSKPRGEGLPEPEIEVFDPRTIFDTFVEEFIKDYELDEGQITTARSILDEYKDKANDFRNAKKAELAQLAAETLAAIEDRDRSRQQELDKQRKELLAPVYELFGQMEERLMALLTSAQREKHASATKPRPTTVRPVRNETKKTEAKPATEKAENKDDADDSR